MELVETSPRSVSEAPRQGPSRAIVALVAVAILCLAGPFGLAGHAQAAPTGRLAYVANLRSNTVSVYDPTTDTVVATIPVGSFPFGVAVSPDGSQVYVTDNGSNTVSVIDAATKTVTATIPVGSLPEPVAFSPDGAYAYVGVFVSPGVGGVDVIDTATRTVIGTIQVGSEPSGIAVTPDGSQVYVANFVGSSVSVIDAATNTVSATIASAGALTPAAVAISPDGARAYTANFNSNNVSVIDTATNTILALVPVGGGPVGVSLSPDGTRVYVSDEDANTVSVIDSATDTVIASVPVGATPTAVVADPTSGNVYVTNGGSNSLSVFDAATEVVTSTVPVGNTPFAVAIQPAVIPAKTATLLTVSPSSPVTENIEETLTATISPAAPSGTVQFEDGGSPLGSPVAVTSGSATLMTTLGVGGHTLTAVFAPSSGAPFVGSTSNSVSYQVVGAQTITFASIPDMVFTGAPFTVSPTASSGLTVSLAASGACTVTATSPGTVTLTGVGACSLTATQPGDADWSAATPVTRAFTVSSSTSGTADGGGLQIPGGAHADFHVDAHNGSPNGTLTFDGAPVPPPPPPPKGGKPGPPPPPPFHYEAKTITAFGISADGKSAWFAGTGKDGSSFLVYVEDNGKPGPGAPGPGHPKVDPDVF
jgi:YVTN family beta-propeller protein